MLGYAGLLLAASMALGQAEDASSKEHLQGLQPILGRWVCEGALQEDVPALGKKGDRLKVSSSHRWILDRSAIQLDWTTEVNGEEAESGRALIAWDPTTNRIMEWAVTKSGNHSGPWTRDGNVWTYSLRGVGRAGESQSKIAYSNIGPDSFTFQVKGRKLNGEELEDSAEYHFKRVDEPRRSRGQKAGSDR